MDIKSLTLSALREQRPDLVTEIEKNVDLTAKLAAATEEGKKMEAKRIAEIDAASLPGFAEIVTAHKADLTKTGADCAMAIIAEQKKQITAAGDGLKADEKKVEGLRNEFKPANGEQRQPKAGEGLEGEAKWKAEYAADAKLQAEFGKVGGESAYLATMRAESAGLVREIAPKRAA